MMVKKNIWYCHCTESKRFCTMHLLNMLACNSRVSFSFIACMWILLFSSSDLAKISHGSVLIS